MLNLHHLAVFHATAAAGSVSGGAQRLFISQPAVSKQLGELERNLKVKLFDRHAKGVRLTNAGLLLQGYAERIFALSADAESALDDLSSHKRGTLSIGAGPTVSVYLLPPILVEFRRRFPGIVLHLETSSPSVLRQRLNDGQLDLGLTESPPIAPEIVTRIFMHDALVPVVSAAHRFCGKKSVRIAEFCAEPFVARSTEAGTKSLTERTLEARGFTVEPVLTVGSTEAIKQAVAAGLGVGMISRLAIRTEVAAAMLCEIKVKGLAIRYPLHHVQRRNATPSDAAKAFMSLLSRPSVASHPGDK